MSLIYSNRNKIDKNHYFPPFWPDSWPFPSSFRSFSPSEFSPNFQNNKFGHWEHSKRINLSLFSFNRKTIDTAPPWSPPPPPPPKTILPHSSQCSSLHTPPTLYPPTQPLDPFFSYSFDTCNRFVFDLEVDEVHDSVVSSALVEIELFPVFFNPIYLKDTVGSSIISCCLRFIFDSIVCCLLKLYYSYWRDNSTNLIPKNISIENNHSYLYTVSILHHAK